jgi:hypothetical protein
MIVEDAISAVRTTHAAGAGCLLIVRQAASAGRLVVQDLVDGRDNDLG